MRERVDLGKAMREALPVYEAPALLQAWAREEARKLDQESSPQREQVIRPLRSRVWRSSQWRIAAGLVIAAAAGWGAGVLRPVGSTMSPTNRTTTELVDAHGLPARPTSRPLWSISPTRDSHCSAEGSTTSMVTLLQLSYTAAARTR
jgi:hypothetical protein